MKRRIRLTEGDLRRIVNESVRMCLNESQLTDKLYDLIEKYGHKVVLTAALAGLAAGAIQRVLIMQTTVAYNQKGLPHICLGIICLQTIEHSTVIMPTETMLLYGKHMVRTLLPKMHNGVKQPSAS